jgi:AMMECR1 domain-containing protein
MILASFFGSVAADARTDTPGLDAYRDFAQRPEGRRLLAVARDAMRGYWDGAQGADTSAALSWPGAPVGVYLSLVDASGTRACVGSTTPYRGGLPETVRALAIEVLQADRRRAPIRREEVATLRIVIAFAGSGERVSDPMEIDPGREGLRITSGSRNIAFLPGEARTVAWALREAMRVGIISEKDENPEFHCFPVVTLSEPIPSPPPEEDADAP